MLNLVACDPNMRLVDIYHLIDEASLAGWQSGLYYVDHTPKQSAATVHDWIASTGGGCQGPRRPGRRRACRRRRRSAAAAAESSGPRIVVAAAGRMRIFDAATPRAPSGARAVRRRLHGPDRDRARRRQRRRRLRLRGRRGCGRIAARQDPERQDRRHASPPTRRSRARSGAASRSRSATSTATAAPT